MSSPSSLRVKPVVVDSCNYCCCPVFFKRTPKVSSTPVVLTEAKKVCETVVEKFDLEFKPQGKEFYAVTIEMEEMMADEKK